MIFDQVADYCNNLCGADPNMDNNLVNFPRGEREQ